MYCIVKLLENAHSWEHSPYAGLEHPDWVPHTPVSFITNPVPYPLKHISPFPLVQGIRDCTKYEMELEPHCS